MSRSRTRLRYGESRRQVGVLRQPANPGSEPTPVVVLLHGGFWRWPYGRWLMWRLTRDVRRRGWASYDVEYRRLGRFGGGGGWPNTFDDVRAAFDRLVEHLDITGPPPVVVVGHSAGGHLALWLAGERSERLDGVVTMGAVTDLQESWDRRTPSVRRLVEHAPAATRWSSTSPIARLPTGVPTTLVHGVDDATVSASASRSYADAARVAGDAVRVVEVERESHLRALDPGSATWAAAAAGVSAAVRRSVRRRVSAC